MSKYLSTSIDPPHRRLDIIKVVKPRLKSRRNLPLSPIISSLNKWSYSRAIVPVVLTLPPHSRKSSRGGRPEGLRFRHRVFCAWQQCERMRIHTIWLPVDVVCYFMLSGAFSLYTNHTVNRKVTMNRPIQLLFCQLKQIKCSRRGFSFTSRFGTKSKNCQCHAINYSSQTETQRPTITMTHWMSEWQCNVTVWVMQTSS